MARFRLILALTTLPAAVPHPCLGGLARLYRYWKEAAVSCAAGFSDGTLARDECAIIGRMSR